jgi:WD40 repeat protein
VLPRITGRALSRFTRDCHIRRQRSELALPPPRIDLLLLCMLLMIAESGVQVQERAAALNGTETTWRPVWFIDGPIHSSVSLDASGNELQIREGEVVLALVDGQRWARPLDSLQRIRYFRRFERPPAVLVAGDVWTPNPAALFRSTNHFVDLVFAGDSSQEIVLTLRLDKSVYKRAIETLQRLTARPVVVTTEDRKALPAAVKSQLTREARVFSTRKPAVGPSVSLNFATDSDGRMLAAVLRDGSIQVWEVETGSPHMRWAALPYDPVDWHRAPRIAFRPKSHVVAVSSGNTDDLSQWDATAGVQLELSIPTRSTMAAPFWFSPDGSHLMVGSEFDGFSCWDADAGSRSDCLLIYQTSLQQSFGSASRISAEAAAFSPDGSRLALAANVFANNKTTFVLALLEWPTGRVIEQQAEAQARSHIEIQFIGNHRLVERQTTPFSPPRVRELQLSGPQRARLKEFTFPSGYADATLSERLIAVWGERVSDVLLYSPATARVEGRLATGVWASAAAFVPPGRLAVGAFDGTVQIWDTSSGDVIRVLRPGPFSSPGR